MENSVSLLISEFLDTGNETFFEQLLEQFSPLLNAYARKLYYLDYEDSLQELSISLYEAVSKMKNTDNEYACISYIKKSIVHKFTKLYRLSVETQQNQVNCFSLDCNSNIILSQEYETENCISHADLINKLKVKTPTERNIIFLIMQGYSDEEIGDILGYTRQYINRIKKKIIHIGDSQ